MEELINDIVKTLVDEKGSLESALLKTKVLAYKIKNDKLANWVNDELNGYENDKSLPDFRKNRAQILGVMSNGFQRVSNTTIPIFHLDKDFVDSLTKFNFTDGIGTLEHLMNESGEDLMIRFPPEVCAMINRNIPINGYIVEDAHKRISIQAVKDVLSTVRSKLLEFLLELENEFEINLTAKEMKDEKEKINELVSTKIYGNNNVIIAGDHNTQNVSYKIQKNNFDDLVKVLRNAGVAKADITELKTVIDIDKPNIDKKDFGPKVKEWIKKMTWKAIDGGWQIGIGAAGQILANSLSQYYGF